jgi:hypothetical protein
MEISSLIPCLAMAVTLDYDGSKADPVEDMSDGYLDEEWRLVEGKKKP